MSQRRLIRNASYSPEAASEPSDQFDYEVAESAKYYMRQVGKLSLLDEATTNRLIAQAQLGLEAKGALEYIRWAEIPEDDDSRRWEQLSETGVAARNRVVEGHLRLVAHIARLTMGWVPYGSGILKEVSYNGGAPEDSDELPPPKFESVFRGEIIRDLSVFSTHPLPIEDRIQQGNLGVMKAVEKYNPAKKAKFSSFAWKYIEGYILRAFNNDDGAVPIHMMELIAKARKAEERLLLELGRQPTENEIRDALHYSSGVYYLREARNAHETTPLHQLDKRLHDRTDVPAEELAAQILREEILDKLLAALPQREADILAMRFGFVGGEPMTMEVVGEQIGVTRERVRQLENLALERLRHLRDTQALRD
jgi:RNA polymerase primary sigma factor